MFFKSIKDFFHNPVITIPSIFISLAMAIMTSILFNQDYINKLASSTDLTNYTELPAEAAKFLSYLLLLIIFYFLISPFIKAMTNFMICNVADGSKANLFKSLRISPKFYVRLICTMVFRLLIYILLTILFTLASIPSLISIYNNPNIMPPAFLILLIVFGLLCIAAAIILSPIEAIIVHDDIGFIEAIGKGIKFGFKQFHKLLGVGIVVSVVIIAINYLTSIIIPDVTAVSTFLTTIVNTFFVMYIINLYRHKKNPL